MKNRTSQSTFETTRTPTTNPSLLDSVSRHPDSDRIDEFARIYEPIMRRYARQAMDRLCGGYCEADCDDLVQEAFVAVSQALRSFRYDPAKGRFRNYLSISIRNLSFRLARRSSVSLPVDPAVLDSIAGPAGSDADREAMLQIWSIAYALVVARRNFSPNTQAIFRSHVLEGISADEVAEEFKTTANAVYQIKDRVLRAVRAEIDSARSPGAGLAELHEELLRRSGPREAR